MRLRSRALLVSALLGGALGVMALPGATDPTCRPMVPAEPVCLTVADCQGLEHAPCPGAWTCVDAACAWTCDVEDPGCYSDADCAAGQACTAATECLAPPDCPLCGVCWGHCVDAVGDPCAAEPGVGSCGADLTCQCRPPADCPLCAVCAYGCYPPAGTCRSDLDCGGASTCDVAGTPDYCGMLASPTLPVACWGVCRACPGLCPAVLCPAGQTRDPCTCACSADPAS